MPMFGIIAFLLGAVLGARFKVLVLAPAMGVAVLAILGLSLARRISALRTGEEILIGIMGLQLGYLGGVGIRWLLLWSRIIRPSVKWKKDTRSAAGPMP
jgi:hypothetical protein